MLYGSLPNDAVVVFMCSFMLSIITLEDKRHSLFIHYVIWEQRKITCDSIHITVSLICGALVLHYCVWVLVCIYN